jgi:hypothetical protein
MAVLAAVWAMGAVGAQATEVWSGLTYSFAKGDYTNWTLPENQDRITDNVWMTRADNLGIFNIAQEDSYYGGGGTAGISPIDTEWAYGTTADYDTLTYDTWAMTIGGVPPTMIGQDMVVHLITDDVYIDIRFDSWTAGNQGGGFSYTRAIPEPASLALLAMGGLLAGRRRR